MFLNKFFFIKELFLKKICLKNCFFKKLKGSIEEISLDTIFKRSKNWKNENLFPKFFKSKRKIKENFPCTKIKEKLFTCNNNSLRNYLNQKDIPFFMKLIAKKSDRSEIKFTKIGNRYFRVK